MADGTRIEWATTTWNPVTGCTKISAGCKNCYAERMSKRLAGRFGYPSDNPFRVTLHPDRLGQPLRWRKPRRVFVASMGDLFHDSVPFSYIQNVWNVMETARKHTFIVLTKRPERMREFLTTVAGRFAVRGYMEPLPNVIGMVTAENQKQADKRIPWLLQTPFAVRGVSVEPMLGAVDLTIRYHAGGSVWHNMNTLRGYGGWGDFNRDKYKLHWVICGAETGPGARPMDLDCAKSLRDQCKASNTPYFFKRDSDGNRTLGGEWWEQYP